MGAEMEPSRGSPRGRARFDLSSKSVVDRLPNLEPLSKSASEYVDSERVTEGSRDLAAEEVTEGKRCRELEGARPLGIEKGSRVSDACVSSATSR